MTAGTSVAPATAELPSYILAAIDHADGLARRIYQTTAAMEAFRILRAGGNAEINLPPGTGKTLISQIVACMWLREQLAAAKVLCVVPTSILRRQHFNYCEWWAGGQLCTPLEISSEWSGSRRVWHQKSAEQSDFWFTLPQIFSNVVDTSRIPPGALDQVTLVILDEYDAFSIGILTERGQRLRFTKDYARLLEILRQRPRSYLLMSATPARHQKDEQ
jgi:RecG-like helicase